MKIFTFGLDHINIQTLKESGYEVVTQNILPDASQLGDNLLIMTSERVALQRISEVRGSYPDARLLYWYQPKQIKQLASINLLCSDNDIYFLAPRSTTLALIEKVKFILEEEAAQQNRVIGIFGSGPGIGCTSVSKVLARRIAATGKKTILLGLNLYDPGMDQPESISLDQLRSRITRKMLTETDFENLIKQDNYLYLPGNYDFLATHDYTEEEIEYLIDESQKYADVVICDFGSIPESAAWYVGMQHSALRFIVTHQKHSHRLLDLLELAKHLDLQPLDFQLILNRNNISTSLSGKISGLTGSEVFLEISNYEGLPDSLPLGKKEIEAMDAKIQSVLTSLGLFEKPIKKKGRLFG